MWTIWRLKWVDLATGIRFENMDVMDMDCCPAIRVPILTPGIVYRSYKATISENRCKCLRHANRSVGSLSAFAREQLSLRSRFTLVARS